MAISKRKRDTQISPVAQDGVSGLGKDEGAPSAFKKIRCSLYLPLSPIGQAKPLESLCAEHISPRIMTYYEPLGGILLAYQNPQTANHTSLKEDSSEPVYATSVEGLAHAWLSADFVVFRPERGTQLQGYITLQNENHISLLCYNQFNATIERKHIPRGWRWTGAEDANTKSSSREMRAASVGSDAAEGYFTDTAGKRVDGPVRFRVLDFESVSNTNANRAEGFIMIEGTLLSKEAEDKMRREDYIRQSKKNKR